jgi:hypothetical protein
LLEARKPFWGCSFSNGVFSIDGTNVPGGLCSTGASIELVKKKCSSSTLLPLGDALFLMVILRVTDLLAVTTRFLFFFNRELLLLLHAV